MFSLLIAALDQVDPVIVIQHVGISQPNARASIQDQAVVIRRGGIVAVGRTADIPVPEGATLVNGTGKFLIPGLWDMHVHLLDQKTLPLFVANGVTGVRVMWGSERHLGWKRQFDSGDIISPRLKVGSPIVDGPKPVWTGTRAVNSEEQGRQAVSDYKAAGYDFIKVYSLLSRDAYFGIADEAKKQKIPLEGHIPYTISQDEAMAAGQKSTEHLMGIINGCSTGDEAYRKALGEAAPEGFASVNAAVSKHFAEMAKGYSVEKRDKLMRDFAKSAMWHCPTLVVLQKTAYMDELGKFDDPRMKYMSPLATRTWNPSNDFRFKNRTSQQWEDAKTSYRSNLGIAALLHKSKVRMLAGTDCFNPYVYPGFSIHEELALFVGIGMTPGEALATATLNPAQYYGDDSGVVEVGMRSDLVMLDADPLVDIKNTAKVSAVFQRGSYYDRAKLDLLLKEAESEPANEEFRACLCIH